MVLRSFLSICFFLLIASPAANAAVELSGAKQGCNTKCGDITVPYPFGIGVDCAANEGLYVTCDTSYSPPRPFIADWNLEIVSISESEVRIKNFVAHTCYDSSGYITNSSGMSTNLLDGAYTFSDKNNFFSTGCNTIAYFKGVIETQYTSGCISLCRDKEGIQNGSCSGMGCCKTSIPKDLTYLNVSIDAASNDWEDEPWTIGICSYAFLAEADKFKFQAIDILDPNFKDRVVQHVPRILDWVVEKKSCKAARRIPSTSACQKNSDCVNSDNGHGYRCKCKNGYDGNPYLEQGCQDIDECKNPSKHKCITNDICVNIPGSYKCTCPQGTDGDGLKNGTRCNVIPTSREDPTVKITLGFGIGILLLLIGIFGLYIGLQKRRLAKLRERFFKQNGGLLLQQHQISSHESSGATRIYTAEELQKATNNYNESHIIGQGGNGTVYRGILQPENKIIAIKKSNIVDKTQIEQFINEVVILTQINQWKLRFLC